ncbi:hypothetical protein FB45DRAFT_1006896 [Roridomyces roridus]|uniref:Uncharacterized protein n=1 Tax=Roridomyces roridus TaxID=1738132 RepID=A0AAD7FHJ5_9AGAR|nr:hypothetical protein FB45DRAFT_1006896 [Roridomyces roridus]
MEEKRGNTSGGRWVLMRDPKMHDSRNNLVHAASEPACIASEPTTRVGEDEVRRVREGKGMRYFVQFVWSHVTANFLYGKFSMSQGHKPNFRSAERCRHSGWASVGTNQRAFDARSDDYQRHHHMIVTRLVLLLTSIVVSAEQFPWTSGELFMPEECPRTAWDEKHCSWAGGWMWTRMLQTSFCHASDIPAEVFSSQYKQTAYLYSAIYPVCKHQEKPDLPICTGLLTFGNNQTISAIPDMRRHFLTI